MPRVGARMWMSASGPSAGATSRRLVKRQARPGDLDDDGLALPRHAQRDRRAGSDGRPSRRRPRRASRRRTSPCRSRAGRCRRCSRRRTRPRPTARGRCDRARARRRRAAAAGARSGSRSVPKSIWPPSTGPGARLPLPGDVRGAAAAARAPGQHREGDGESADRATGHACCNAGAGANLRSTRRCLGGGGASAPGAGHACRSRAAASRCASTRLSLSCGARALGACGALGGAVAGSRAPARRSRAPAERWWAPREWRAPPAQPSRAAQRSWPRGRRRRSCRPRRCAWPARSAAGRSGRRRREAAGRSAWACAPAPARPPRPRTEWPSRCRPTTPAARQRCRRRPRRRGGHVDRRGAVVREARQGAAVVDRGHAEDVGKVEGARVVALAGGRASSSWPLFPAATTNSVLGCAAMASAMACDGVEVVSDALTTRAPWSAAHAKAAAMSDDQPRPVASSARSAMIPASGAAPVMSSVL